MGYGEGGRSPNQEAGKGSIRESWAGCGDLRLAGSLGTSGTTCDQDAHTVLGNPFPTPVPPPSSRECGDPSQETGGVHSFWSQDERSASSSPRKIEAQRMAEPGPGPRFPTSQLRATSSDHKTLPSPQTDLALSLSQRLGSGLTGSGSLFQ